MQNKKVCYPHGRQTVMSKTEILHAIHINHNMILFVCGYA